MSENLTIAQKTFAYILSTFLILNGTIAILSPTPYASQFGIPISNTSFKDNDTNNIASYYVSAMGARNMAQGLLLSALVYTEQKRAFRTMFGVSGLVVGGVDAWVVWRSKVGGAAGGVDGGGFGFGFDRLDGDALGHLVATVVITAVARWVFT